MRSESAPNSGAASAAQQVLAEEGDADGGEVDARLAHEVDAEERDQAHARGDRDEVRRDDDC